jgi:topoisomerase IA-like protein
LPKVRGVISGLEHEVTKAEADALLAQRDEDGNPNYKMVRAKSPRTSKATAKRRRAPRKAVQAAKAEQKAIEKMGPEGE